MSDELTFTERSVLLILMAEARELPNAYLTNHYRVKFDKPIRENLERQNLINVRRDNRLVYMELSDLGAKRCMEEFGEMVPAGGGVGGAALYAMLDAIKRRLDHIDQPVQEFFVREAEPPAVATPAVIESRIRQAYAELAPRPGDWVTLADLRDHLDGLDRGAVDRVLVAMHRLPKVRIDPDSDQKNLSDSQRAAAVIIGNQHKHQIAIEV